MSELTFKMGTGNKECVFYSDDQTFQIIDKDGSSSVDDDVFMTFSLTEMAILADFFNKTIEIMASTPSLSNEVNCE